MAELRRVNVDEISEALGTTTAESVALEGAVRTFVKLQAESWNEPNEYDQARNRKGYHSPELPLLTVDNLPNGGVDQVFVVVGQFGTIREGKSVDIMTISLAKGIRVGESQGLEGLFVKSLGVGEITHGGLEITPGEDSGKAKDAHLRSKFRGIFLPQ